MKFTVDGETYEMDEDRFTFGEAKAIEKITGMTTKQVSERAQAGGMDALQAFIFIAMKRQRPSLRISELDDMAIGDIEFEAAPEDPTGAVPAE